MDKCTYVARVIYNEHNAIFAMQEVRSVIYRVGKQNILLEPLVHGAGTRKIQSLVVSLVDALRVRFSRVIQVNGDFDTGMYRDNRILCSY